MNPIIRMRFIVSMLLLSIGIPLSATTYAADPASAIMSTQRERITQPLGDVHASKLIGSEVRNAHGENLGEVKDLIVDINNERIHYAVLSFSGFLGLGDKLFAYPLRMFTQAEDGNKLVLNIDKDKLKAAPGFEGGNDRDWNDQRYMEDVDRYHGTTPQRVPDQVLRSARRIIGEEVDDRDGSDMGKIIDLVVNMSNGNVRYAVFEFDKLRDVNERTILVSLNSFVLSDSGNAVLNVDRSKLDNALEFEKKRWPNVHNPLFLVDVGGYLVLVDPQEYSAKGSAVAVFARLDTNLDNKLTPEEARHDSKVFGAWAQFDSKSTGVVTRDEFLANYKTLVR